MPKQQRPNLSKFSFFEGVNNMNFKPSFGLAVGTFKKTKTENPDFLMLAPLKKTNLI